VIAKTALNTTACSTGGKSMSAIAGICHWDGRPIPEQNLKTLASHSRAAGPDAGGGISPIPGLVLQAHLLHFDQLSATERQPHVFDRGSVVTFDGRLDGRDDLLIRLHHDLGSDITDAAIIAAAFARWGLDCLPRLIGDWSLAIWDAPNRRLILARDYMGNRPLHYLAFPGGLAWATNLDALADCFDLYGQVEERFVAARLVHGTLPAELTPFRGAMSLRAGHVLVASANRAPEVRRYWTFQPTRIRYRALQDYADRARELMTEAVRVRLRVRGRVWSHLSGGFDSSSIVCLASALIKRQSVEASSIQTLSLVSTNAPESDESRFINAVERFCGLTTIRRDAAENRLYTFEELLARRRPFFVGIADKLEGPVAAAGDRVVLSGEIGDLVMIRSSRQVVAVLEALHEGRPLEFLRLCLARTQRRHGQVLPFMVRIAMMGYLPALTKERNRRRRLDTEKYSTGAYREPNLLERVTPDLMARAPKPTEQPSVMNFPVATRALVAGLYGFADHPATTSSDFTPEVWMTYPFTHRPLAEFMIGVPQLAFWDAIVSRAGMKRALADVLPPEILTRRSKGDPRTAKARNEQATAAEYLRAGLPPEPPAEWRLVRDGYLRLDPINAAIDAVKNGLPPGNFLRQSVNLEAWLRAGGRPSSTSRRASPSEVTDLVSVTSVHR
jgi:asparagine synthase (glutamine-hydrolysing)